MFFIVDGFNMRRFTLNPENFLNSFKMSLYNYKKLNFFYILENSYSICYNCGISITKSLLTYYINKRF